MPLHFTDAQIWAEAERLGITTDDGTFPQQHRSRVVASLATRRQQAQAVEKATASPVPARTVDIHPGQQGIDIDGRPLPWLLAAEAIDVRLLPDGSGTVRLTLHADSVRIHPSESKENRT